MKTLLSILLWIALATHAAADLIVDSSPQRTTFDQLLDEALHFNHALQATREGLRSSEYRQRSIKVNMLPDFSIVTSGSANKLANDTYSSSLVISQPLYQGGRIVAQRKVSQFEYDTAHWALQKQEQTLRLSMMSSWHELLKSRELEALANEALIRLGRNVNVANHFYQEGQNWRSDVLQAELALARGEQDLVKAKNDVLLSKAELNQLRGKPIDWQWQPVGELSFKENPWGWQQALEIVQSLHPDTRQAELAVRIAEQRFEIAQSVLKPQWNLVGRINENHNRTLNSVDSENSISLTVSMPVWNWRRDANARTAQRHDLKQSQQRLQEIRQTALLAANQAFLIVNEASMRLSILEQSMQQAVENYRVNELRYQEQLATANELLDAERILSNNQRDRVIALADYLTALAKLEFAIGYNPGVAQ